MSNSLSTIGMTLFITGLFFACGGYFSILLGFGKIGIVGNSLAAFFQSIIGNVTAGSFFATFTSLGMKGVFAKLANWGTLLRIGGLFTYIKSKV